jgi:hypothetical protein
LGFVGLLLYPKRWWWRWNRNLNRFGKGLGFVGLLLYPKWWWWWWNRNRFRDYVKGFARAFQQHVLNFEQTFQRVFERVVRFQSGRRTPYTVRVYLILLLVFHYTHTLEKETVQKNNFLFWMPPRRRKTRCNVLSFWML